MRAAAEYKLVHQNVSDENGEEYTRLRDRVALINESEAIAGRIVEAQTFWMYEGVPAPGSGDKIPMDSSNLQKIVKGVERISKNLEEADLEENVAELQQEVNEAKNYLHTLKRALVVYNNISTVQTAIHGAEASITIYERVVARRIREAEAYAATRRDRGSSAARDSGRTSASDVFGKEMDDEDRVRRKRKVEGARERSDVPDLVNEVMKIKLKTANAPLVSTRPGNYAVKKSMKPMSSRVGGPGRGGDGDPDDSDDDGDHDHGSNGRRGRDRDDDDDSGRRRDRGKPRKRKAERSGSEEVSPRRSESSSREPRGMIAVPKMPALDPKNYWWNGNTAFLRYYIEKWRRLLDPRNYSAAQAVNFMLQCVPDDRKYIINDCSSLEAMVRKLSTYASDEGTYLLKIVHQLKSHSKSQTYHEDKRLLEFFDKALANITKLNSAYTLDYFTAQVMINKLSSDSMRSKYLEKLKDLMVETKDAHRVDNYLVTMQQIIVKAKVEIDMIVDVNQGDLSESVGQAVVYSTQVYGRGNDFEVVTILIEEIEEITTIKEEDIKTTKNTDILSI